MIEFATADLDPHHRFEQWREVRGKGLFGVTIELAPERRHAFKGMFRAHSIGSAIASEIAATPYQVNRTAADIARVAADSLCIAMQVKGPGLLATGADRFSAVKEGDMAINYSDLPYSATPSSGADFHFRMIKVPFDDELMLGKSVHDLFAIPYVDEIAIARPFRALFNALTAKGGIFADPEREVASLTRLAMLTRGKLASGLPEVRAAIRDGLLYAALEIMTRDKHHQRLTPTNIATELEISVRQLHVIFESAEQSFSRTLAGMRLIEAKRLLAEVPGLPVTQIAYACGFDSLATFYRLFASGNGVTPREFRLNAQGH